MIETQTFQQLLTEFALIVEQMPASIAIMPSATTAAWNSIDSGG
jgi:hypothetical protein